jgi:hypothetical protein
MKPHANFASTIQAVPPIAEQLSPIADLSSLSIEQLQHQLKECWVRYEKAAKEEMAPCLYYFREKVKKQGSRSGEGFCNWVEANLGLSLSTANRWADDYARERGYKTRKVASQSATSSQMNRSAGNKHNGEHIDEQFQISLILSPEEKDMFSQALHVLGKEEASRLIFSTVVKRAEKKMDELAKVQTR